MGLKVKPQYEVLPLVEVRQENAIVLVDGVPSPLPIEQCDLVNRLGGEAAILGMPDDATKPQFAEAELTDELEIILQRKLTRIRSHWPKEIVLREKCVLQEFAGGKLALPHSYAPGTAVRLISVENEGVVVMVDKSIGLVRLKQVDLVTCLQGITAILATADDPVPESADAALQMSSANH